MSILYLFFFAISLFCALVCADYTIDDSNYSVLKFSENPAGPVWGPFGSDTGEVLQIRLPNGTMQTVDATQCFDGTYTYAACSASNNCAVQFSFTGSGLTIYVLQAGPQGMSASLSIDSGTATTATLGAPPPPQYYIPHVPLFNVQNIPSGTHSAVMTVLDWNGGFSGMMLDYIDVNQAQVGGSTSQSPSPNPTPNSTPAQSASSTPVPSSGSQTNSQPTTLTGTQTNSVTSVAIQSILSFHSSGATSALPDTPSGQTTVSSSTSKKNNTAAVVSGVVGGAVGLVALLGLALFCIRRRRRQHRQALNERPAPLLPQPGARFANVGADPFASSSALFASQPFGALRPLQSWTDSEAGSTPNYMARDASNPNAIANLSHVCTVPSSDNSAISSAPVSVGVSAAAISQDRDASRAAAVPASHANEKAGLGSGSTSQQDQAASRDISGTPPNAVLTDDQADFVNSLFRNNVPAPVVARVLERMLANPQGTNSTGYNDPELRSHLDSGSLSTFSVQARDGAPWQSGMSDIGDGEATVGTAPPSYDYVQAQ